ncbi:hypothetical protein KIL84_010597 [Mauremys mutica]|uniref:Zinc finger BED domain-containing protein 5 n=1 Tax=Mauremys mutica TaxID=74926 RepID=A0A9D4B1N0_9SAUR|nr:hypothetical protein KIL84_010597 [Mauremys mutica]
MPHQEATILIYNYMNYHKTQPVGVSLFAKLHEGMGSNHVVVFHTEARWLSKGKILGQFFELGDKCTFAMDFKKSELNDFLCDLLAYITDIYGRLNKLNAGLQEKNTHTLQLSDRRSHEENCFLEE